ncbi:MAG TPA: PhzF family phenazine biosynthesis protein, partial [Gemmatimonadales bacterium]|nr:PhzF family phenazine biosynthesis protein [Gemmatimonadales bacterium]
SLNIRSATDHPRRPCVGLRIVQVDAFTARPFGGNPAAVCVLDSAAEPAWMQNVAREMNLSETAFLVPAADGFDLRWFTPTVEVALCGHATLASAHVLWQDRHLPAGAPARFHTKSGLLTAAARGDWIELDFPSQAATAHDALPGMLEALGARATYVAKNRTDFLVEVRTAAEVRALRPDLTALRALPIRGVMVTAPSDEPVYDFISRFFAPGAGVDEDPVTGSAHCCLAPHWAAKLGKTSLTGYQASARGGVVRVTVAGDRVKLSGQAVTVLTGELTA